MNFLAERIISGLKRKSLTCVSEWACRYRVMGSPFPGPWTFRYHPWLKEMHDSTCEINIGQKSAQAGYTEMMLNWCFKKIDIDGESCLYVLPTDDNASDFSATRFDPAIDASEHLEKLFTDVKNTALKRAGMACLYVRGSRSRNKLKSIPVANVAVDELDEMVQANIPMIWERQSGQVNKQRWLASTPTVPDFGINALYNDSTCEHVFFRCPGCSRLIELSFPENLVITADDWNDPRINDSHLKCVQCGATLPHNQKPSWLAGCTWEATKENAMCRGFYVNQLYSSTVKPAELAKNYLKGQSDPAVEQEFYNSKLGLPFVPKGCRITEDDIKQCEKNYTNMSRPSQGTFVTIGIDVGSWLHCFVAEWTLNINASAGSSDINMLATPRAIGIFTVREFEELDGVFQRFTPLAGVIDANPERRKAMDLVHKYPFIKLCYYQDNIKGRSVTPAGRDAVSVDRSSWIDLVVNRIRGGNIILPVDTPMEYKQHLQTLVKRYERTPDGNYTGKYINLNKADHYAHAQVYSEIALTQVQS